MTITIFHGDSRDVLKGLADNSIDSCVTDPPYALVSIGKRFGKAGAAPARGDAYARASAGFMGKTWDTGETAFDPDFWREVLRVLKPGGHVLAFGGTRSYHRLAVSIEDAGFEIRDMFAWLYGSGFPKSHDVAKGIDKRRDDYAAVCAVAVWLRPHVERAGFAAVTAHFGFKDETMARARWTTKSQPQVPTWAQWLQLKALCGFGDDMDAEVQRLNERKGTAGEAWQEALVVGITEGAASGWSMDGATKFVDREDKAPNSPEAEQWEGWGTAVKPALEPICVGRKPLSEGSVVANVLRWGTGALNIDASRIAGETPSVARRESSRRSGVTPGRPGEYGDTLTDRTSAERFLEDRPAEALGRFPANVMHDGSDEVVQAFPVTAQGGDIAQRSGTKTEGIYNAFKGDGDTWSAYGDEGTAARFFKVLGANDDELVLWRAKATIAEWNPSLASTVDGSLSLPSEAVDFALSVAVTWASRGTLKSSPALSMIATPAALRRLCEAVTMTIQSFDNASLRALPLDALFPNGCRVNVAATVGQTDTMTITVSHWKSGGSADHATFNITRNWPGHGGPASIAERWFYSAKADDDDRLGSKHPTVKPVDLMAYYVRLVTPPGGVVLDPFAGSGSTGVAAMAHGFRAVLIEREAEYVEDIHRRIAWVKGEGALATSLKARRKPKPPPPAFGLLQGLEE